MKEMELLLSEFADRVAAAVVLRLGQAEKKRPDDDGLVDEPAMAEKAGISPQTLARRRKAGDVPFVQAGRRVLYRPSDVIAALTKQAGRPDVLAD